MYQYSLIGGVVETVQSFQQTRPKVFWKHYFKHCLVYCGYHTLFYTMRRYRDPLQLPCIIANLPCILVFNIHIFLQNLIDKNTQRLINLGKLWEEKRIPLIDQIRDLSEKCSTSEVSFCVLLRYSCLIALNQIQFVWLIADPFSWRSKVYFLVCSNRAMLQRLATTSKVKWAGAIMPRWDL